MLPATVRVDALEAGAATLRANLSRLSRRLGRIQRRLYDREAQPLLLAWTPHLSRLSSAVNGASTGIDLAGAIPKGSQVHVKLKGATNGAAVVLDGCVEEPAEWKGRIQVKYELSGAVAHVKANKVDIMWSSAAYAEPKAPRTRPRTRLWHAPTTILAVHSTACFRRLARLEVRPGDRCVEIGCSFGQCTRVLRAALSASPDAAAVARGSLLALDLGHLACKTTEQVVSEDAAVMQKARVQPHLCPFAVACADVLDDAQVAAEAVGRCPGSRPRRSGQRRTLLVGGRGGGSSGGGGSRNYGSINNRIAGEAGNAAAGTPATDVPLQPPLPQQQQRQRSHSWPKSALLVAELEAEKARGEQFSATATRRHSWPATHHPGARVGLLLCEAAKPTKVFVDVGGNREIGCVTRLLDRLLTFDPPPNLIVVKNEEVFEALAPSGVAASSWKGAVMPKGAYSTLTRLSRRKAPEESKRKWASNLAKTKFSNNL